MEQKRIKVRLTKNSPYSDYGYYEKGDIGYIDGYVNDNAVIILENGKFAKADLRWIEVVNDEDKNVNTELAESEDEVIRKELLNYLYDVHDDDEERSKWIAWLEKQGEQNPNDKVKPKFKVGDWVVRNGETLQISGIDTVLDGTFHYWFTKGTWLSSKKMENAMLWTIQDAKDGDVVVDKSDGTVGIFQSIGHHPDGGSYNDPSYCFLHCRYDDGFFYADFDDGNTIDSDDLIPATKEQHDTLMKAMADAGYTFDFKKKELKKIEQKQEWSEEDERLFQIIIDILDKEGHKGHLSHTDLIACVRKLKSLRPPYYCDNCKLKKSIQGWKPSDEQIFELGCVVKQNKDNMLGKNLQSLLDDLKKLKEE